MRDNPEQSYVLASDEPALLMRTENALRTTGARVRVALAAEAALESMLAEAPALAILDVRLPGMELGQLLAKARVESATRFPIVLIADSVSEELKERMAEGVIDDIVPPGIEPDWLLLRVEMALRAAEQAAEMERLRDQVALEHFHSCCIP